jgi:hypothetical protein
MKLDNLLSAIHDLSIGAVLIIEWATKLTVRAELLSIYESENGLELDDPDYEEYYSSAVTILDIIESGSGEPGFEVGESIEINKQNPPVRITLEDGEVIWPNDESTREYCCEQMGRILALRRPDAENPDRITDGVLRYFGKFDEYGIVEYNAYDGGEMFITLIFCPWCGQKLQESKRASWFSELEKLGIHNMFDERIPEKFQTDAWWKTCDEKLPAEAK